jgi:hypothetical protein
LATSKELAGKIAEMEKKYDGKFSLVFDILNNLIEPPPGPPKEPIGFRVRD